MFLKLRIGCWAELVFLGLLVFWVFFFFLVCDATSLYIFKKLEHTKAIALFSPPNDKKTLL